MNETRIYLNTWGAYNDGCIGFGWMTPEQAKDFMNESMESDTFIEKYGEEFFVADIDNYLGVDFGTLEYTNVDEVIETIEALEELTEYEKDEVIAIMEFCNCDAFTAIEKREKEVIYPDKDTYFASMDEYIDEELNSASCPDLIRMYFDYEAYHRDIEIEVFEASNGLCILQ